MDDQPHVEIRLGDCREIIATLPDCSIDSIVTDPPYELGFMGKKWDATGIAYDVTLWAECLRVLKPGGHLLAFGGTRTYHRMTCAIEDAGFEIRDSIHWLYGSGFPKSHDVSKGIDKQRYDRADVYRVTAWIHASRDAAGISNRDIDNAFGFAGMAGHWTSAKSQPAVPTLEQVPILLDVLGVALDDVPDDIRQLLWDLNGRKGQPGENWARREVLGTATKGSSPLPNNHNGHWQDGQKDGTFDITAPATDAAREWEGWGTALKPAHEPVVMARKPLIGTVAANVLQHGTGALNIDGARVGRVAGDVSIAGKRTATFGTQETQSGGDGSGGWKQTDGGRWPANVIFTHTAECGDTCADGCPVFALNQQSGIKKDGVAVRHRGVSGGAIGPPGAKPVGTSDMGYGGQGGASRFFTVTEWDEITPFFYCAKPSKAERNAGLDALPKIKGGSMVGAETRPGKPTNHPIRQNFHPTVKPLDLMRYLVRLVTPPGGTVLEPFAGSGTTLAAAILEGFNAIGCELTADYLPIIEGRIAWAYEQYAAAQPTLFGETNG